MSATGRERPAPLILVVQPAARGGMPEPPFGSYAAVATAGHRLLSAELSQRLGAVGAAVLPLEPVTLPAGEEFHWGRWFNGAARAALGAAGNRPIDAIGYAGAGSLALVADAFLEELISAIHGEVVANNRYSADAFVLAGDLDAGLRALEGCRTDNAAVRCLEAAGFTVRDLSARPWSRFDVDTPLDLALLRLGLRLPGARPPDPRLHAFLEMATLRGGRGLELAGLEVFGEVVRDRERQLVVAGRMPSATWAYLETEAACRVRAFIEERGMRAARDLVPRSLLADWASRLGPADLVRELCGLGDALVLDTRVLMAAIGGSSDASAWPPAEERFASDFGEAAGISTPWLRELVAAAAAAPIPVLLGGHALVSDGLRVLVEAAWLGH